MSEHELAADSDPELLRESDAINGMDGHTLLIFSDDEISKSLSQWLWESPFSHAWLSPRTRNMAYAMAMMSRVEPHQVVIIAQGRSEGMAMLIRACKIFGVNVWDMRDTKDVERGIPF